MEGKLLLDALLESSALFQCEGVGFRNDGDDVDDIRELLQDDDVDWFESVAGGLDEEETAVDAGVLNVALSLCSEFLSEVGRVLVFDIFDNWVPTNKY